MLSFSFHRSLFVVVATSALALGVVLVLPQSAHALTTYVVTSSADTGTGTLRAALTEANTADVPAQVTFASSITKINLDSALTIAAPIDLEGAGNVTIERDPSAPASNQFALLRVQAGSADVTFAGVTLSGGDNPDTGSQGAALELDSAGSVVVSKCTLEHDTADNGGAIGVNKPVVKLSISDSTFTSDVGSHGGGLWVSETPTTITGSTFDNDTAADGGGGIYVVGAAPVTISNTTVDAGSATVQGGDVDLDDVTTPVTLTNDKINDGTASTGGGLYASDYNELTITGTSFADDHATDGGGGVALFSTSQPIALNNDTWSEDSAAYSAGAYLATFASLSVSGNEFVGNHTSSGSGGGLTVQDGGTTSVTTTDFEQNQATEGGAGIFSDGGTSVSIDRSTFSDEQGGGGLGSSVFVSPDATHSWPTGSLSMLDSTVLDPGSGGYAVYVQDGTGAPAGAVVPGAAVSIRNSTLIGNGDLGLDSTKAFIGDTILARAVGASHGDLGGPSASDELSYDLLDDGQPTVSGDVTLTDDAGNLYATGADLGPLGDNGGPTLTTMPQPGSPAIDHDPHYSGTPATDERGLTRDVGAGVDTGAVEVQTTSSGPTSTPPPSTSSSTGATSTVATSTGATSSTPSSGSSTTTQLAETGSPVRGELVLGLSLLIAGAGILAVAARRRPHSGRHV